MNPSSQKDRLGSICAITTGVLYIFIILYVIAVPTGQRYDPGRFFENYAENPITMNVLWIVMASIAVLAFGVIPSVGALVETVNPRLVRAVNGLGLAGSTVSAVSFLTMLGRAPGLAQAYVDGDSATKAAIAAVDLPQLDPFNILVLGGVGVWLLVVNVMALKAGKLPKLHAAMGVGMAIFLGVAVVAAIIQSELLDQIAAGVGAFCAPVWYIWVGLYLNKTRAG